jgi:hypothetical protein
VESKLLSLIWTPHKHCAKSIPGIFSQSLRAALDAARK